MPQAGHPPGGRGRGRGGRGGFTGGVGGAGGVGGSGFLGAFSDISEESFFSGIIAGSLLERYLYEWAAV